MGFSVYPVLISGIAFVYQTMGVCLPRSHFNLDESIRPPTPNSLTEIGKFNCA